MIPPAPKSGVTQSNVTEEGIKTQPSAAQEKEDGERESESASQDNPSVTAVSGEDEVKRDREGEAGSVEGGEEAASRLEHEALDSGAAGVSDGAETASEPSDDAESAAATTESVVAEKVPVTAVSAGAEAARAASAAGAEADSAVVGLEAERTEAEKVVRVFEEAKEAEAATAAAAVRTASSSSTASGSKDALDGVDGCVGEEASMKEPVVRDGLGAAELARLVFHVAEEARAEQRARDEREGTIRLQMMEVRE